MIKNMYWDCFRTFVYSVLFLGESVALKKEFQVLMLESLSTSTGFMPTLEFMPMVKSLGMKVVLTKLLISQEESEAQMAITLLQLVLLPQRKLTIVPPIPAQGR